MIFLIDVLRKFGSDSNCSVCFVGVVSKTMRVNLLNFLFFVNCNILVIVIVLFNFGGGVFKSFLSFKFVIEFVNLFKLIEFIKFFVFSFMFVVRANCVNFVFVFFGLIFSVYSILFVLFIFIGCFFLMFCVNELFSECVGFVFIISVSCSAFANFIASEFDSDVFLILFLFLIM